MAYVPPDDVLHTRGLVRYSNPPTLSCTIPLAPVDARRRRRALTHSNSNSGTYIISLDARGRRCAPFLPKPPPSLAIFSSPHRSHLHPPLLALCLLPRPLFSASFHRLTPLHQIRM
ncbi:hypothetical protein K523DRAFT_325749 [Schizophyllum commune Tattone D]|nr:hypothetical protein K523DRAFT_325749 [Schizophyllum commune Tattone D]